MKNEYKVKYLIFRLFVKIVGELSHEELVEFLGEDDAKILSDWYFENRQDV